MALNNGNRFEDLYMQNGRYNNEFEQYEVPIGKGTYGTVFKAKNEIDDKEYAIKKILISSTDDFNNKIKELKIWAKLDCDYFVQYRSSWVEIYDLEETKRFRDSIRTFDGTSEKSDDYEYSTHDLHLAILHIQMDLCSFTLRDAMIKINEHFDNPKTDKLPPIAYYIASELLIEILESINFLHKQNIIHRDLKPTNILIKSGVNGKFIKIADFGIATFQTKEEESHTQLRGTFKYMAPEVLNSRKYDTKADIYSIGVLTQEMFNVDMNKKDTKSSNFLVSEKYEKLMDLINDSMAVVKNLRPNCDQILKNKNLWAIDFKEIRGYIENTGVVPDMKRDYDMDKDFANNFIQTKYRNHSQK